MNARLADSSHGIEGLTLSSGELLDQARSLRALLERLRHETRLSAIVFTGYTWQEVSASPQMAGVLPFVDVLVAGRYDHTLRLARGLRGSDNTTTHFLTDRYSEDDLETVPVAEIAIDPEGHVIVSGIDPPAMRSL